MSITNEKQCLPKRTSLKRLVWSTLHSKGKLKPVLNVRCTYTLVVDKRGRARGAMIYMNPSKTYVTDRERIITVPVVVDGSPQDDGGGGGGGVTDGTCAAVGGLYATSVAATE